MSRGRYLVGCVATAGVGAISALFIPTAWVGLAATAAGAAMVGLGALLVRRMGGRPRGRPPWWQTLTLTAICLLQLLLWSQSSVLNPDVVAPPFAGMLVVLIWLAIQPEPARRAAAAERPRPGEA